MIKQEFIVDNYYWRVYVYYDIDETNIDSIIDIIEDVKFPKSYKQRAYTILKNNKYNCGFTYSNIANKTSVIGITKTTSASQFVNSFTHEIYHLVNHIARYYNISYDSETICYLYGKIAQTMYKRCHTLICDCCKHK